MIRGGAAPPDSLTHYPFSAFHVRALRNRPVSLCPFLSFLGRFCSIFCFWFSVPHPLPARPPLELDARRLHLLLASPLLPDDSPHYSLLPSFPKVSAWLASLVPSRRSLSFACVTSSPGDWSLPAALCPASSPTVWGSLTHSDSWDRTCILLSPIPPQTCGSHRVT